jgi:hypothetical protein
MKKIGIQYEEKAGDSSQVLSEPDASNSSFAEIALLDSLAQDAQSNSAMDSRGARDIHIKQSVPFSHKIKDISVKTVLECLRWVIHHMAENPSQPGLGASGVCTDAVRDLIMDENAINKIQFSRLTALAFLGLCSKEAAARSDVQYLHKLRSISHWPGRTRHLLKYNMNDLEYVCHDMSVFMRSVADSHSILANGTAIQYAPAMGGGKYDRPAQYRSMIPNGLGGVLQRIFEKQHPKFDYKKDYHGDLYRPPTPYIAHRVPTARKGACPSPRASGHRSELTRGS